MENNEQTINKVTENARYSEVLDMLLEKESGIDKILKISYESDYSGYVDADVLLKDGRVLSYRYYYGSCSGCDEWESECLSNDQIIEEMKKESTFFNNLADWTKYDENKSSNRA